MSEDNTTEFSFILKPSEHGVGVFATHNIKKGTFLRLFTDEGKNGDIIRKKVDVPEIFLGYCIFKEGDLLLTPKDFSCMPVGWYLNHSKSANAVHRDYAYYASRDILAGEEVITDYNLFGEPEEEKDDYYKK